MSNNESNDDGPPAALLTPTNREYLRGEKELDGAAERALRSRIRKRIQAGLRDFSIILDRLADDDLDKVFSESVETRGGSQMPISDTISRVIAVLYLGLPRGDDDPRKPDDDPVATVIATGIERALTRRGGAVASVSVEVDVELRDDLSEIAEKDLTELSTDVLEQLLFADEITPTEFANATLENEQDDDQD